MYLGELKHRQVAIKVDHPNDAHAQTLEKQFISEISTLYNSKHNNLCALLPHSADGPTRALVYEYCANGDLWNYMHSPNKPALNFLQRMHIAVGTGRGLEYLHSSQVIHRDVKTMNILLDAALEPKLSDFGTVREQKQKATTYMTKVVVGTEMYMPPGE